MPSSPASPRCPYCNAQGLAHLAQRDLGLYLLVYCRQCGAIYGVVPKPTTPSPAAETPTAVKPTAPVTSPPPVAPPPEVARPTPPPPKAVRTLQPPPMPPQHAALNAADLIRVISEYAGQRVSLSPTQLEHIYRHATRLDGPTAPRCEQHQRRLVRLTVPPDAPRAGARLWVCAGYAECRCWQPEQPGPVSPQLLALVGSADLSQKVPYNPEKLANQMKAAGLNRGTAYRHYAIEAGPPLCLTHKVEMVRLMIPPGYQNSGCSVWVCSTPDCQEWELAE